MEIDSLVMVALSLLVVVCWFAAPSAAIGILWVGVSGASLILFASLPERPTPVFSR